MAGELGELKRRFNSAPAVVCDSASGNQGGPHCQDGESDKVTKGVTNGTCRLCVARFSSRHVILTTLDGANGLSSPEEAIFPPEWFLAPSQPSDRSWRVLAPKVPRPSGRSDSPESACERFLRVSPAGHLLDRLPLEAGLKSGRGSTVDGPYRSHSLSTQAVGRNADSGGSGDGRAHSGCVSGVCDRIARPRRVRAHLAGVLVRSG
jgi:hypothetical protein